MKKFISVILSLALIATIAISVYATSPNVMAENEKSEISPRYSFTNSTATNLGNKIENGKTILIPSATATGYRGITTKITIVMELQKFDGTEWITVESWNETFDRYRGALEKEIEVSPGTYLTYATYTVYSGNQYEVIGSSSLPFEFN